MGMENKSGRYQKDDQQKSSKPCKVSQYHGNAAHQFKEDGTEKKKGGQRHAEFGHVLCCPFKISNFSNPWIEKD